MAVKGKILSIEMYSPEEDGIYEIGVAKFKKYCKALRMDDETIMEKIMEGLAPFKTNLMNMGLSEEEADNKIEELLEIELEDAPEEEVV